jgi:chromosome segregation ATPase
MGSDIERRLASLEARFNPLKEVNLVEVLKDYERRLRRLESQTQ